MKVGLILCKCFITYPNSISVLISFVFSSWIINEFDMRCFQASGFEVIYLFVLFNRGRSKY